MDAKTAGGMELAGKKAHSQSLAGTGCPSHPCSPSTRAHCVQGEMWMEAPLDGARGRNVGRSGCFQQLMRSAYVDATVFCLLQPLTVKTKLTHRTAPLYTQHPESAPPDTHLGCGARPCESHQLCCEETSHTPSWAGAAGQDKQRVRNHQNKENSDRGRAARAFCRARAQGWQPKGIPRTRALLAQIQPIHQPPPRAPANLCVADGSIPPSTPAATPGGGGSAQELLPCMDEGKRERSL